LPDQSRTEGVAPGVELRGAVTRLPKQHQPGIADMLQERVEVGRVPERMLLLTDQIGDLTSVGLRHRQPSRCARNQSRAWLATASRVPGSSKRWVAPGTISSRTSAKSISRIAPRFIS